MDGQTQSLQGLLKQAGIPINGAPGSRPVELNGNAPDGEIRFVRATCDSRKVLPGDVFFCLSGHRSDGHQFLAEAARRGAAAAVVAQRCEQVFIPQIVVKNTRRAWAAACMAIQGNPAASCVIAGVTGTNGKTTTSWLLHSILETAGHRAGLIGTIEYRLGAELCDASLTTPDSETLAQSFRKLHDQQIHHCVMEISSHALDQDRCSAISLETAAITNITQDHFDYHGNASAYRSAKMKIEELLKADRPLLLSSDDPGCRIVQKEFAARRECVGFGFAPESRIRITSVQESPSGSLMTLKLLRSDVTLRTPLIGRHNQLNCLLAAGMAEQLRISPSAIIEGIESVRSVPGRLERVTAGQHFSVFVDFAHTPDGIRHCISTVRPLTVGRIVFIFGAGGDRDRLKRPLMAQAASAADVVVLTSDNPRSEVPAAILDDLESGFSLPAEFDSLGHDRATRMPNVFRCEDREEAIRLAFSIAEPGDSVIIAGRGHESHQEIRGQHRPFDDRLVARRLLTEMQQKDVSSPCIQ
ncbi:MAG: UDP-N-acetylmuramoyl-L-alanyl-D-glutamate--2,6-diaminopimelate ligase [Planctomyces sp.]|jgi:UDP-N-acetylmuramoyl-L-alanyl-D-glutamate--2,6-diaminopimelate ligase